MNIKVVTKNKEQKDEITKRIYKRVKQAIDSIEVSHMLYIDNNKNGFNFHECEIHVVDIWSKIDFKSKIYNSVAIRYNEDDKKDNK